MSRLTENDNSGIWWLKDVPWVAVSNGAVITPEVQEKLYAALSKLKDYEESGLSPEQLIDIDNLYREKCEEVAALRNKASVNVQTQLKHLDEAAWFVKDRGYEETAKIISNAADAIRKMFKDEIISTDWKSRIMNTFQGKE